ncbi:unnamed protein product [Cylindrotheca closterium]|uniref:G-protein coupled receptors family 2 profile 2 domain-containing protein n=1 Tax=Cylindrotheca closterium TaxID=2856 RepID=A0AAD2CGP2_9STRA|nr:unnamed protein product [Cylindrotheca closterium]
MVSSQEVLEIIPKFTGGLSFVFSLSTAVYIIFFSDDTKKGFYNRLVIGMCFADMLSSLAFFFSTWPMPTDSDAVIAAGNEATCRIQGFFIQYSISSQLYVGSIGAFYLLAIKYGWKERHFAKWGPLFHFVPVGFGLGSSIAVTVLDIIGPANLWCWIAPQDDRPDLAVNLYRMALFYVPLWLAMLFVGVILIFVFLYVRKVTKVAEEHVVKWMPEKSVKNLSQDAESNDDEEEEEIYCGQELSSDSSEEEENETNEPLDDSGSISSSEDAPPEERGRVSTIVRNKQKEQIKMYARRRREIAYQCLRFALAFYITWTPLSCVRLLQLFERPVPYGLLVMSVVMTPLQGLPNLLAFLYPMIRKKWKHRKRAQKNDQKNLKEGVEETKPPAIVTSQPAHPTYKKIRGIHGSSAWGLSMGYQHTHDFQLSSDIKSEEQNDIYTRPEMYFMRKK